MQKLKNLGKESMKCSFCNKNSKYLCDAILIKGRVESRGCDKHLSLALVKQGDALRNEQTVEMFKNNIWDYRIPKVGGR